jgi:peptidylprolyl isomerase
VRIRPIASLSVAAAAVLLLAGCSAPDPEATATTAGDELCAAAATSGAASDAVTVEGDFGVPATATFDTPLDVTAVERTVLTEGSGDAVESGDLISYGLTAFDAATGEQLGQLGYNEGEILPQAIAPDSPLGAFFGCTPVGTRVVATLPASENSPTAAVYVLDLTGVVPAVADGEDVDPVDGFPTVELADDGEPTITLPDTDAPGEVQLEQLKQGDGAVVQPGDTVLVQYKGVKWSDGEEFDSSWSRGEPASFPTTGVVDGFRQALEGQSVGSQVLAVIPPAAGYGAQEGHELQNETLVFVVDILATQQTPTAG